MRGGKYRISGQLGHYGKLRQGYVEQFCPGTYRLLCMKNRVQEHYAYVDQAAFLVYWRLFEDFFERIGLIFHRFFLLFFCFIFKCCLKFFIIAFVD